MTNRYPPMAEQCCDNCRFARHFEYEKRALLQCRHSPPEYSTRYHPRWPTVYLSSWCGAWAPAEGEA
jgi:hypothetical protein